MSSYQKVANSTFNLPFMAARIADGTYLDKNWAANSAVCKAKCQAGTMNGFIGYYVFELLPVAQQLQIIQSQCSGLSPYMAVMLDIENWQGKISGNHSTAINQLAAALATWLGSWKRVILYGNRSDLANLCPQRDSRLSVIVASYGSRPTGIAGMIGWQYSDGDARYSVPTGWTRSAVPFGACDMNYSDYAPAALAQALGLGQSEDDVQYLAAYGGAMWVLPADLSCRTGIPDGADATTINNTGNYQAIVISDLMMARIPDTVNFLTNPMATHADAAQLHTDLVAVAADIKAIPAPTTTVTNTGPAAEPVQRTLFSRPESGARAYLPVNNGAARRWVSGTEAQTWPEGYAVVVLQNNDPFWSVPSLTQALEDASSSAATTGATA